MARCLNTLISGLHRHQCRLGVRRLAAAHFLPADVAAEIRWRPFLLNPELPPGGIDRQAYLERKFGSNYRIQRIHAAALQAGQGEGIAFNFDAIRRMPNSMNAHRLINFAGSHQSDIVEALFQAYFVESIDIGEISNLVRIAAKHGLNPNEVEAYLLSGTGILQVETENARMHRLGVSGVPCYIFEEQYAIAGAQEPEIIARLLDIAREAQLEVASR